MNLPQISHLLGHMATREALLFRQIAYWHHFATPKTIGRARRPIGIWIVKTRSEWAQEAGLSLDQVKRAMARLKALGLIETEQHLWGKATATYLRVTAAGRDLFGLQGAGNLSAKVHHPGGADLHHPGRAKVHHPTTKQLRTSQDSQEEASAPAPAFGTKDSLQESELGQGEDMPSAAEVRDRLLRKQGEARDPDTLDQALRQYEETPAARRLEQVWRYAWLQSPDLADVRPRGWTDAECGKMNQLARFLNEDGPRAGRVLVLVLRHWEEFREYARGDTGFKLATRPRVGDMLRWRDTLDDWARERERASVRTQQRPGKRLEDFLGE